MRMFLAIFCPPLAVLLCGKPVSAVLNVGLTFAGVLPGIVHAMSVVSNHSADKRTEKLAKAIARSGR